MIIKILKKLKRKIYLEIDRNKVLKNKYGVFIFYLDDFKDIDKERTFGHFEDMNKINTFLYQYGANNELLKDGFDHLWDYSELCVKLNFCYNIL